MFNIKYPFQFSTMADVHLDTSHRMVKGYCTKLAVLEMPITLKHNVTDTVLQITSGFLAF